MKYFLVFFTLSVANNLAKAQTPLTPERLWQLGRVTPVGMTRDGNAVIYKVTTYDVAANQSSTATYSIPLKGGTPTVITLPSEVMADHNTSPDGKYTVVPKEVKVEKVAGKDFYPDLPKADVQIYDNLMYRHWDEWEDGSFGHLIVKTNSTGKEKDIMENEPFDCPQKPFGGEEDYTWSPDSQTLLYVTKKKSGKEYALSTNTDIYAYHVTNGMTSNITEGMMGYDTNPAYASTGALAWLSMKRDGYESDKNDIVVRSEAGTMNLTQSWDGTVNSFKWSNDGSKIYFAAPVDGTIQLFGVDYPGRTKKMPVVKQITKGDFDINVLVGQTGNNLVVSRTDMNHASELFTVNLSKGSMQQLTHVNDAMYSKIAMSKVERRYVTTTDDKKMLVYVIYPPNFDPAKKYPTLLYCQGGPESALSQFYSFRWNFQLMASQGYIVVAPSRRGMPGFGVEWNEAIAKDFGGQAIRDYLTAIDEVSKESFVDKTRLGCVGASYGGYSVYYLAGIHNKRFKTFIAHDGVFDQKSMYGTTEEMFFVNWDLGGAYWDKSDSLTAKAYHEFDPSTLVDRWNTPILIIQGGKDYRISIGQGLEAFQAAQLHGIKSKLLYFPTENHWILHPQNALVWQREFFGWLRETL